MIALLDKFETIEIKNDTRLSDEDKLYCERQQQLYSKVLKHYRNMFAELLVLKAKSDAFYLTVNTENEYFNGNYKYKIYGYEFVEAKKDEFADTIKGVHNRFIEQIICHFRNKYNVKIDSKEFDKYFTKECPTHPDRGYFSYSRMSDEEIEKYKEELKQYEIEYDNYLDCIINAELDFNLVVDDIFVALGGFSFMEKVEQEIKQDAKNAITNSYRNTTEYTLKNGKISFDNLVFSRKCNIFNRYEISFDGNGYRAILRALTYFNANRAKTSIYDGWMHNFMGYRKTENDGIYGIHKVGSTIVTHFKYFKNGKWEVTFDNHSNALKFAKEFLGYTE